MTNNSDKFDYTPDEKMKLFLQELGELCNKHKMYLSEFKDYADSFFAISPFPENITEVAYKADAWQYNLPDVTFEACLKTKE